MLTFLVFLHTGVLSFPKAKNPELNTTLNEIQKKIVLPAQLPLHQRKIVFRRRWKAKLEHEPLAVDIGDLKVRFKHLDGCGGQIPDTGKILHTAMGQMKTHEDWHILVKIMQALNISRKIKPGTWVKVIRYAGEKRNLGPIFDLAKLPEQDGLRLDTHEKVQVFLTGVIREAALEGWGPRAARNGLRDSQKILRHLIDEAHRPKRGPFQRMHEDPTFLAVPVTFAAVLVKNYGRADEFAETLRKYTQAMLEFWPEGTGLLSSHHDEHYVKDGELYYMMDRSKFLEIAAPILKGLEAAEQAVDSNMAAQIASRRAVVAEEVDSAVAYLREQDASGKVEFAKTKGGFMYNLCFPEMQEITE